MTLCTFVCDCAIHLLYFVRKFQVFGRCWEGVDYDLSLWIGFGGLVNEAHEISSCSVYTRRANVELIYIYM